MKIIKPKNILLVITIFALFSANSTLSSDSHVKYLPKTKTPERLIAASDKEAWLATGQKLLRKLSEQDLCMSLKLEPRLRIREASTPDAFVTKNKTIVLNTGILALTKYESEYAFLLAHELSHIILGHHKRAKVLGSKKSKEVLIKREIDADRLAIGLMKEAGYEYTASYELLDRLSEFGKENHLKLAEIYPSLTLRKAEIKRAMEPRLAVLTAE